MTTTAEAAAAPQETPRQTEAFVLTGEDSVLRPETLQLQSPQADEVLIEVAACGVCHTDLHVIKDEVAFPKPCVLGHEVSGIVRAVGPGVDHVAPGDRVACSFIMPCGDCRHCRKGLEDLCETFFNLNRLNGHLYDGTSRLSREDGQSIAMYSMAGHARYAISPARAVHRVPDGVSLTDIAVVGCSLFTAYGAVKTVAEIKPGESVAVVAAGGVGLSIIHVARAAGAEQVIAVDVDDEKLALARELGATHTVNSTQQDPVAAVQEMLGHGVDVAFEALGSVPTVKLAVDLLDDGGRAVLAGIAPAGHTLDIDITKVVRRKIQILGSFGARSSAAMPEVIRLAAEGHIDLQAFITDRFDFTETDEAYRRLNARQIRGRGLIEVNPALA